MTALVPVTLTYWPQLRDPVGQRAQTTWSKLLARLSTPKVHAVKMDIPGFALAAFVGNRRSLANVEQVFAVGLDLDEGVRWDQLKELFATSASFVHSTWSSTLNEPRARVFLLLSRAVNGDEYRKVYASVAAKVEAGGLIVDRAASDPSRLWFLPATKHGAAFVSFVGDGMPVNVEAAIDAAPKPTPYVSPPRSRSRYGTDNRYNRAKAYIASVPGAISGSGGHSHTFMIAQRLVRGFELPAEDAFDLMASMWNERCAPPWSERELRRKVDQAASSGTMPLGQMLERDR